MIRKIEYQFVVNVENCPAIDIHSKEPRIQNQEPNSSKNWKYRLEFWIVFNAETSNPKQCHSQENACNCKSEEESKEKRLCLVHEFSLINFSELQLPKFPIFPHVKDFQIVLFSMKHKVG